MGERANPCAGRTIRPPVQSEQAIQKASRTTAQVQRNVVLGILNGTLMRVLDTLAGPSLVLPWFVAQLGGSAVAVGLLLPITAGGWFLPQLLMARSVHSLPQKLPLFRAVSAIRVVLWIIMVIITLVAGATNPTLTLWSFIVLYTLFCFGSGVSGLSWFDVIARAIPANQRGQFFGWRDFTGGILAIGASVLVGVTLNEATGPKFPHNYGLLLALAGVAAAAGYYAFGKIDEPPPERSAAASTGAQCAPVDWRAPLLDRSFRLFVLARIALLAANVALPFFGLYAKERLGAPDDMAGTYSGALTAAMVVSTLVWGRLSDRKGNLLLLRLVSAGFLVLSVLPLVFGPRASYLAYTVVFVLMGAASSGSDIASLAMGLELAPPEQRSAYLGLLNSALGVVSLLLVLGGWIVERWGLEAVFLLSAAMSVVAVITVFGLSDPRGSVRSAALTHNLEENGS